MRRLDKSDIAIANKILMDDSVFPMISDDGTTEEIRVSFAGTYLAHPEVFMLHPNEWSIFMFVPRNSIMTEVHTAVLPDGRGEMAIAAGKESLSYMFENTNCLKVISLVPEFNGRADLFARRCNLKAEGIITDSFLKTGILYNQTIYGITRKEWISCQPPPQ